MTEPGFPTEKIKKKIPTHRPTVLWFTQADLDRIARSAKILGCSRSELMRTALRVAALTKVPPRG